MLVHALTTTGADAQHAVATALGTSMAAIVFSAAQSGHYRGRSASTTGNTAKTRRLFCPTSQARRAKIFVFPKDRNYDLAKPARLGTGDVLAIRHQT